MQLVQKTNHGLLFYFLAFAIFIAFVMFTTYGDKSLFTLWKLRQTKREILSQNKALLLENIDYQRKLKTLNHPTTIEHRARESLGMVYADEIVYMIQE